MKCRYNGCRVKLQLSEQVRPCWYCKKCHCTRHRLPEDHECQDLDEGLKRKDEVKVKPKFVDYPRDGDIGV